MSQNEHNATFTAIRVAVAKFKNLGRGISENSRDPIEWLAPDREERDAGGIWTTTQTNRARSNISSM
jgi:hypothetical protein